MLSGRCAVSLRLTGRLTKEMISGLRPEEKNEVLRQVEDLPRTVKPRGQLSSN